MPRPVPNEDGLRALGTDTGGTAQPATKRGSVANEAGLVELGRQINRAGGRRGGGGGRKHRSHQVLKWSIATVVCLILLMVVAGGGYAWYLNDKLTRIQVKGLVDGPSDGASAGTENILMVGSTSRCALAVQNPAYGLCQDGVNGVNSDVVMILHVNPAVPSISILSIPRDLFIPNARNDGANKIDAGLYDGPSQLVASIEEDFGIPIQHYVELNFDSFANVVNALGGIDMYFPEPVYDAYSGLNQTTTGCVHLDGYEALQVVRARHLQYQPPGDSDPDPADWPYEAQSDLARIRRDHEFLRVLAEAVSKQGLANPITDDKIVAGVVPQLEVDSGFSASQMVKLVLTYHGVSIEKSPQLTVPVEEDVAGQYEYEGGLYGDVEFPVQPNDQQVVDQFLGVSATTNTMTGAKLPAPGSVTVSVLNGTGVTDQAGLTAAALGQLGFNVVGTGDTESVGVDSETTVTYDQLTPQIEGAAQAVADSLSGSVVLAYGPTSDGADVTVTTGSNFSVNPPAPAPTSSTSASSTTSTPGATGATGSTGSGSSAPASTPSTTTTTTAPSDGDFTSPTQSVEALAPWDPRSCTPSGGEGP